tara:strand:+ start:763 stop:2259 length:1497 start_codon:yes stop_codon:yes gene_type:complete
MGYKLNYTFLGQKNETSQGNYTPLIIPKMPFSKSDPNFTAQEGQQIPASRIGVDEITAYENKDAAFQAGVTPFSRIRNYYFDKIANNNFSNMSTELVDLVKNFVWTISPQTSKTGNSDYNIASSENNRQIADEVPYISIKEKYFLVNNIVAQALYNLTVGNNLGTNLTGKTFIEQFESLASDVGSDVERVVGEENTQNILDASGNVVDAAVEGATSAAQAVSEQVSGSSVGTAAKESSVLQRASSLFNTLGQGVKQLYEALKNYQDPDLESVLFPYQRLYFVGPTGFQYKIPYLSPQAFNIANSFGSDSSGSTLPFQDILASFTTGMEAASNLLNVGTQAGKTYIERVKYYDYPQVGEPIEVKIPLYNTNPASYEDVCNNYKLCFLLLYQNSPLKQDKLVVEPPCLYDVKIPGMKRQPYCYMSNIRIIHQGNTRIMDIDISDLDYAAGGPDLLPNGTVQVVIPDAYILQLTFQPMLTQTKNMLFTTISDHDSVVATET